MEIDAGIIELQKKLGLADTFFEKLLEEDDWSFIIKLHALIEAVCTSLILYHLKEPSLEKIVSRIELSNTTSGKVAILKALELLGNHNRKFIIRLSELRNSFVHNVRNCHINLTQFVTSFDNEQIKRFAIDLAPLEATLLDFQKIEKKIAPLQNTEKQIDIHKLINRAKSNPKIHIWFGAYNLLTSIVDMHGYSDYLHYERSKSIFTFEETDE